MNTAVRFGGVALRAGAGAAISIAQAEKDGGADAVILMGRFMARVSAQALVGD